MPTNEISPELNQLLEKMWAQYIDVTPPAKTIYDLFVQEGNDVINDHIALRTFDLPEVSIDVLAKPFIAQGYVESGDYHFKEKKLYAKHWQHPNPKAPKVFISQLLTNEFSDRFQQTVNELVSQIKFGQHKELVIAGRPWEVSTETYNQLKSESDYGAWLAAFGFRANHFTVFVNELKSFENLTDVNTFLKSKGQKLNDSGGEIKGGPEVLLAQSSTLAYNVDWEFSDRKISIPSCYYEFAQRYLDTNGNLYQGFVAASADKIFESTDKGQ